MRSDREKRCANGSRKRGGGRGGDGRRGQRGQGEGGAEADVKSTNPHLNKASLFSGEMLLLVSEEHSQETWVIQGSSPSKFVSLSCQKNPKDDWNPKDYGVDK